MNTEALSDRKVCTMLHFPEPVTSSDPGSSHAVAFSILLSLSPSPPPPRSPRIFILIPTIPPLSPLVL